MKHNGKGPKNIYAARTIAKARAHGNKIKLSKAILKLGLTKAIENAKAAKACVAAGNVSAAEKCVQQLLMESGAAKSSLKILADLIDSPSNAD